MNAFVHAITTQIYSYRDDIREFHAKDLTKTLIYDTICGKLEETETRYEH